jgi:HrpA-like RNA helicase
MKQGKRKERGTSLTVSSTKGPTSTGHKRQHIEARRQLPVYKYRKEICKLVEENDALLVIAETVSENFPCLL